MKLLFALLLAGLLSGCAVIHVSVHTEDHVEVINPKASAEFNR